MTIPLKVTLSQPVPYFLEPGPIPLPCTGPAHGTMATSGPSRTKLVRQRRLVLLSHRVVNEKLEFDPNPYWDRAHAVLTRVTFVPIPGGRHQPLSWRGSAHHRILPQEQYPEPGWPRSRGSLCPGTARHPYYAFNTPAPAPQ